MTLYKDKYRAETTRMPSWDYSAAGYYFVTICTYERSCLLGDIINGEMLLSPQGLIVAEEWQKAPALREKVSLDEWVVMPNHLHGIVILRHDHYRDAERADRDACDASLQGVHPIGRDALHASPSHASLPGNKFGPQSNNLAAIMRGFKSVSTSRIRTAGFDFGWQSRYYDHVIRDEQALEEIREYIVGNPMKWEFDKNHPKYLTQLPP